MSTVRTGEVYVADLDPVVGSEQGRRRPVVVLQNPEVGKFTKTVLIVPLTTSISVLGRVGTAFIPKAETGLSVDSVALGFQVRAVDSQRFKKKIGTMSKAGIEKVTDAVLAALGIIFDS